MIKKLFSFFDGYKKYAALAISFMIIDVMGEIIQPMLMSDIVDIGIKNRDLNYIFRIGGLMLIMALIAIIGGIINVYFGSKAGVGFATNIRKGVFHKIQEFSFSNIDEFKSASLVTRLTNDVTLIQQVTIMGLRILVKAPLMLIFGAIMAFKINSELALVVAVAIPILGTCVFVILKKSFPFFVNMQKRLDRVNGNIQENLTNIRVVKSFVREDFERNKFEESSDALMNNATRALHIVIWDRPLMIVVMRSSIMALLWFGGNKILQGSLQVGELMSFISYITQILFSLLLLGMVITQASRASASAKRIIEVLDTKIDIKDKEDAEERKVKEGIVEFKNVFFKYKDENADYALKDISFKVKKGEIIGIVGSTGSGKTSLVQLIPRLYDATKGSVLVDGVDVRDYRLNDLRKSIGFVLQKNVLFSGTIKDNLKWGNTQAKTEEIVRAAKNAQAHDFIMEFSKGYETELGQEGVNISGGQKQRLSIARAMLKNLKILILDDSTSAVDVKTEAKIKMAFRRELKGITTFIIAQRISSIQDADRIIVLDEGRIAAVGTHEELLQNNKEYQEIYYSQNGNEVSA